MRKNIPIRAFMLSSLQKSGEMRIHIKILTLLLFVLLALARCDSVNNSDQINLSQNRIADIALLEIKIKDIDSKTTRLTTSNRQLSPSSPLSKKIINENQIKISELQSQREISENEVKLLYEIEQEYQNKK
jgi:hypothetical protein